MLKRKEQVAEEPSGPSAGASLISYTSLLEKLTSFYSLAFHLVLARLALHYDAIRTFLKTGLRSFALPSWPHGKLAFPIVLTKSAAVLPLEVRLVGIFGT